MIDNERFKLWEAQNARRKKVDLEATLARFEKHVLSDEEVEANRTAYEAEQEAKRREYDAHCGSKEVRRLMHLGFGRREAEFAVGSKNDQGSWAAKQREAIRIIGDDGIVVLSGDCGTGKTVMAASIVHRWIKTGRSAMYLRAVDFFRGIKSTWAKSTVETEEQYVKRVAGTGLLVIDEIQDRLAGESENVQINNVIDIRYSNLRPTLIITNKVGKDALEQLPRSVVSRVQETGAFISLDWGSFRAR